MYGLGGEGSSIERNQSIRLRKHRKVKRMIISTELTTKQVKALQYMKEIAQVRDKLEEIDYIRKRAGNKHGKKIFSEFIEHYVAEALNLNIDLPMGQKGFDAIHRETGKKFQIKETTLSEPKINNGDFDYLVTVKLNHDDFSVQQIAIFPKEIAIDKKHQGKQGEFRSQKNEWSKYIYYKDGGWIKKEIAVPEDVKQRVLGIEKSVPQGVQ
jgi:hypothetical protein